MIKSIALLFVLFAIIYCHAQIRVGVTGGFHTSNIASTSGVSSKAIELFDGGFLVDLKIPASRFHLEGQALYTSFGYKNSNISAIDEEGNFIGNIGNEKIGYVQVPLLVLYPLGFQTIHIKLGAGPCVAFETNEALKIEGGDAFRNTLVPINTTGRTSTVVGGEIYGGLEFSRFFAAAHYQRSFNNIYENSGINTKWEISSLGFSLGLFLK